MTNILSSKMSQKKIIDIMVSLEHPKLVNIIQLVSFLGELKLYSPVIWMFLNAKGRSFMWLGY